MGTDQQKPMHAASVILPFLQYMGGNVYTPNGVSTNVPVPSRATAFTIAANGGDVYYAINQGFAGLTSPGFVPQSWHWVEGPLSNMTTLHVYSAAGATKVHVSFYCEV